MLTTSRDRLSALQWKYIVLLDQGCLNQVIGFACNVSFICEESHSKREYPLPLAYKGIKLDQSYKVDILVANAVVVETKTVAALMPIHEAQLLTYLKLGGWKVGLLINFNEVVLKDGIRRRVLDL